MLRRSALTATAMAAVTAQARSSISSIASSSGFHTASAPVHSTTIASGTGVALTAQCRSYLTTSRVALQQQHQQQQGSSSSDGDNNINTTGGGASALDVAMRVNRMKKAHQSGGGGPGGKREIEVEAWTALNSLSEEQVNTAEGKAVALLLNSWAYFAKFWEKGKDGPALGGGGGAVEEEPSSSSPSSDAASGSGSNSN